MTGRKAAFALATILLAELACRSRAGRAPSFVALGGDPARVGDVSIPASLVGDVARARPEAVRSALDQLIEDALLAQAGRAAGLERAPAVDWASTTTLARLVPERLRDEARAGGPPTVDELATIRVVHAVVRRPPSGPLARPSLVADAILQTVTGARDDDDFEARAKRVHHDGVQVTVERLPAFDLTGRTAGGGELDPTFVAAAFRLHAPGEVSPVVETGFGWHVIRLIDRVAPDPQSVERLRRDHGPAVEAVRVRTELSALLRAARSREPVEFAAGAAALMAEAAASLP